MGRLLADAQGYAVCAADGEPLGRLIWLVYGLRDLWPVGLRVQPLGRGEATFTGSWEIPVAQVINVQSARREVTVASEDRGLTMRTTRDGSTQRARTAGHQGRH